MSAIPYNFPFIKDQESLKQFLSFDCKYSQFVKRCFKFYKEANREINPEREDYYQHHIYCKHQGGEDVPANIIYVPYHTHAVLHQLLYKEYNNPRDKQAYTAIWSRFWKNPDAAEEFAIEGSKTRQTSLERKRGMFDSEMQSTKGRKITETRIESLYEHHVSDDWKNWLSNCKLTFFHSKDNVQFVSNPNDYKMPQNLVDALIEALPTPPKRRAGSENKPFNPSGLKELLRQNYKSFQGYTLVSIEEITDDIDTPEISDDAETPEI